MAESYQSQNLPSQPTTQGPHVLILPMRNVALHIYMYDILDVSILYSEWIGRAESVAYVTESLGPPTRQAAELRITNLSCSQHWS